MKIKIALLFTLISTIGNPKDGECTLSVGESILSVDNYISFDANIIDLFHEKCEVEIIKDVIDLINEKAKNNGELVTRLMQIHNDYRKIVILIFMHKKHYKMFLFYKALNEFVSDTSNLTAKDIIETYTMNKINQYEDDTKSSVTKEVCKKALNSLYQPINVLEKKFSSSFEDEFGIQPWNIPRWLSYGHILLLTKENESDFMTNLFETNITNFVSELLRESLLDIYVVMTSVMIYLLKESKVLDKNTMYLYSEIYYSTVKQVIIATELMYAFRAQTNSTSPGNSQNKEVLNEGLDIFKSYRIFIKNVKEIYEKDEKGLKILRNSDIMIEIRKMYTGRLMTFNREDQIYDLRFPMDEYNFSNEKLYVTKIQHIINTNAHVKVLMRVPTWISIIQRYTRFLADDINKQFNLITIDLEFSADKTDRDAHIEFEKDKISIMQTNDENDEFDEMDESEESDE